MDKGGLGRAADPGESTDPTLYLPPNPTSGASGIVAFICRRYVSQAIATHLSPFPRAQKRLRRCLGESRIVDMTINFD